MNEASTEDRVLAEEWEEHARCDPLWAILSSDEKQGRQWDVDEFFAVGAMDVDQIIVDIAGRDIPLGKGKALDFGCGVGRLSQALADYFDRVVGADVSPTMIGLARELNFNRDRVDFLLNQTDDLAALESNSVDLVTSLITLQHIPPDVTRGYLKEFLRVLKPGGILVFNLPAMKRSDVEDAIDNEPMPDEAYRARVRLIGPPAKLPPSTETTLKVAVTNDSGRSWEPGLLAKQDVDTHWQAGDGTWKSSKIGHIDVGNHWLSFDGTLLINDDGRVSLPQGMTAGAQAEVDLRIKTPAASGIYLCEVDLVHERVAWFAQHGSPTAQCRITVGAPRYRRLVALLTRVLPAIRRLHEATFERFKAARLSRSRARRRRRHGVARRWNDFKARLPEPETSEDPEPYAMFAIPRSEVTRFLEQQGGEVLIVDEAQAAGWAWESYWYFVRKR